MVAEAKVLLARPRPAPPATAVVIRADGAVPAGPGPDSPGNRRLGHLELAPERVASRKPPLHRASCLPYKASEGSSAGPLSWRRSRNRAFMAAITKSVAYTNSATRPGINGGAYEIRTRVQGFADLSLTPRPTRRYPLFLLVNGLD